MIRTRLAGALALWPRETESAPQGPVSAFVVLNRPLSQERPRISAIALLQCGERGCC
jgi:hypothetical protein